MRSISSLQDLYGNIVLSGGTSMFPGMADRMSKEVRTQNVTKLARRCCRMTSSLALRCCAFRVSIGA